MIFTDEGNQCYVWAAALCCKLNICFFTTVTLFVTVVYAAVFETDYKFFLKYCSTQNIGSVVMYTIELTRVDTTVVNKDINKCVVDSFKIHSIV